MADFYDILAGMINGQSAQVMTPEEANAQMRLNQLAQMRELAAGMGLDPDAAIAGYATIDTPYAAGALPLFRSPNLAAGPSVALRGGGNLVTPALLRHALGPAMLARPLTPNQPAVRAAEPGPVDTSFLPFDSGADIAAGATQTISVSAQTVFKPERLNVPRNIADFFTIDNMTVGNVPLAAATGAVPASSFATDAVGANVRKVTANPGVQVTLVVTNIDGAAHRFRATFFGWSSQPEGCRG